MLNVTMGRRHGDVPPVWSWTAGTLLDQISDLSEKSGYRTKCVERRRPIPAHSVVQRNFCWYTSGNVITPVERGLLVPSGAPLVHTPMPLRPIAAPVWREPPPLRAPHRRRTARAAAHDSPCA